MAKKVEKKVKKEIKPVINAAESGPRRPGLGENTIFNGLSEAIMGFNPGGIGTPLDQTDTIFLNNRWYLISNMRQVLSEVYAEHGLIQTVVDVPVDDGLRGGVEVRTKQLSERQIQDLHATMERQDDVNTVGQALKWNRLYGGAGIVILTDQDPMEPLDISKINKNTPLEFRAVDMWELFWDKQNTEGYDPAIQEQNFEFFSYYGTKLHKSRVMRMKGITPPSFIRPRLRGWGLSIVEPLVRSINQYFKTNDLCFAVLDEFKLDIFKIKNLSTTLMSDTGTAAVQKRVQLANQQKNYQNAITMDSEDDYIQKQLSFSGIAEILEQIRIQIAGDLRMPITKIFGIASQGFNSGEDDIENYNSMIESTIRSKCKYDVLRIIEIRCMQMFGMIPDDLQIFFKPLRMLSAEQEENVKTKKWERIMMAHEKGIMDDNQLIDACNRDALLVVQLEAATINPPEADEVEVGDGSEPKENKTYSHDPIVGNSFEAGTKTFEFKKKKHPRDEDGVFATEGKTDHFETTHGKHKPKQNEGEEYTVVYKHSDEGKKVLLARMMKKGAKDRIMKGLGNGYSAESHEYDLGMEEGMMQPHPKTDNDIENPGNVDEAKWAEAKKKCIKEYGHIKWPVVTTIYKEMGGTFK